MTGITHSSADMCSARSIWIYNTQYMDISGLSRILLHLFYWFTFESHEFKFVENRKMHRVNTVTPHQAAHHAGVLSPISQNKVVTGLQKGSNNNNNGKYRFRHALCLCGHLRILVIMEYKWRLFLFYERMIIWQWVIPHVLLSRYIILGLEGSKLFVFL